MSSVALGLLALPWWRHQMETFSALPVLCAGNSPVTGEFPTQRPVTRSFDVFFDLRLNKRLSKHSWGWWFETPSCSWWHHCNAVMISPVLVKQTWRIWKNVMICLIKNVHNQSTTAHSQYVYFFRCSGPVKGALGLQWLYKLQRHSTHASAMKGPIAPTPAINGGTYFAFHWN